MIEKSDKFELCSTAPEISDIWADFSCPMNAEMLKKVAHSGSFFSYCAGVASYMLEWYNVGGVKITLTSMTLPMKSGLSSSAAICVLVTRAFNQLYGLNLSTLGEMLLPLPAQYRHSSCDISLPSHYAPRTDIIAPAQISHSSYYSLIVFFRIIFAISNRCKLWAYINSSFYSSY